MTNTLLKTLALVAFLAVGANAHAIPARSQWSTYYRADGSKVSAMLVGDEHYHYYITRDQQPLQMNADGRLDVARVDGHVASLGDVEQARRTAMKAAAKNLPQPTGAYTGKRKGLIILVDFPDQQFYNATTNDPQKLYSRIANEVGYSDNDHIGSVHDYFLAQSYGKFDLTFDVVGPIRMKHTVSYYGQNSSQRNDVNVSEMIAEAISGASSQVSFKDYDWDGDGKVDQVFVLYAGYGEATGGPSTTVWPHESSLQGSVTAQGLSFYTYACGNELMTYYYGRGNIKRSKEVNMGIGVICHEFSHCLGIPDMYDTQYTGNPGTSSWDVMCSGSYNGPKGIGEVPPSYTSYERNMAGWLNFTTLGNQAVDVKGMKPISDTQATAYKIVNPARPTEYFLLENRNISGWDAYVGYNNLTQYLANSGLLVLHVDYNATLWNYNIINSVVDGYNDHQRMSILSASGTQGASEDRDTYPLGSFNSISEKVNQGFTLFNANYDGSKTLHAAVNDITVQSDGTVDFSYVPDPKLAQSTAISAVETAAAPTAYYRLDGSLAGHNFTTLPNGLYVTRQASGKMVKVLKKK